jgi:SAM-dependent methyltransferase
MVMSSFPSTVYALAWKIFRNRSDENIATTEVILSFPYWKNKNGDEKIRLLDIGCGDGLLIQEFIQKLCGDVGSKKIEYVTILDPYVDWLREAEVTLSGLKKCKTIPDLRVIDQGIEKYLPNLLFSHNIIFAVHLVYLLEEGVFANLIQSLPSRVRLYAVMDAPTSVFSEIWRVTQPTYLERVRNAHKLIESLGNEYSVNEVPVTSKIDNPLRLADVGIKEMILSMLSYSNYAELSNEDIEYIDQKVTEHSQGSKLFCTSICYEIFKK